MPPTTQRVLHEAIGIAKVEVHVPPIEEVAEREPEPQPKPQPEPEHQYSTWDASKSVTAVTISKYQVTNYATERRRL